MKTKIPYSQKSSKIESDNHCFLSEVLDGGNEEATEPIVPSEKDDVITSESLKVIVFSVVRVAQYFVFCAMFCGPLFFYLPSPLPPPSLLSFYYLSFFNSRLFIISM